MQSCRQCKGVNLRTTILTVVAVLGNIGSENKEKPEDDEGPSTPVAKVSSPIWVWVKLFKKGWLLLFLRLCNAGIDNSWCSNFSKRLSRKKEDLAFEKLETLTEGNGFNGESGSDTSSDKLFFDLVLKSEDSNL